MLTVNAVTLCKMLTLNANRWIFHLALCFMCVSSNEEENFEITCGPRHSKCQGLQKLSATLGSSVLLPCDLSTRNVTVSWIHTLGKVSETELVYLTSEGRLKFLDPRNGRVKAFPNQGSKGNYSICIDELQNSDLGCYHCMQGHECFQVELAKETSTQSEETLLLIYICVGGAALILLVVCSFCIIKCNGCFDNRAQRNTNNPVDAGVEGATAPPMERGRAPVGGLERGADNLVYENDDQDPTRSHVSPPGVLPNPDRIQTTQSTSGIYPNLNHFERAESQRTKHRFHTELFSRLRQASFGRHYYVNQGELHKQQAMSAQAENRGRGKKKSKDNCEYKNPIYNRSAEQLNQL